MNGINVMKVIRFLGIRNFFIKIHVPKYQSKNCQNNITTDPYDFRRYLLMLASLILIILSKGFFFIYELFEEFYEMIDKIYLS